MVQTGMSELEQKQNRKQSGLLSHSVGQDRSIPRPIFDNNTLQDEQQILGNQSMLRFAQSCPLSLPSASICPFGGVCHTCPARVQAKLKIGQPGDKYEQEADRVADEVMRMPDPTAAVRTPLSRASAISHIQRQCPECEEELERKPDEEEEELLQAMVKHSQTPSDSFMVEENVNSLLNGGQPLPDSVRAYFEPQFGFDFSQVRIYTDNQAAHALHACAFTIGRDVIFGAGQYAPETARGKRLLSHELTHVVQQGAFKDRDKCNFIRKGDNFKRNAHKSRASINRSNKIRGDDYIQNNGIKNHKLNAINSQKLYISHNSSMPSIQRYGRNVHMDHTSRWASSIFRISGANSIPQIIAREDQGLDEGWTHPTWTSITSFLRPGSTPLHFPSRVDASVDIIAAIRRAANSTSSNFDRHAADFGRQLHRYQDSYSHSFPPNAPYNRLSSARGGAPRWLRPLIFGLQRLYPNTQHGKGAVFRHVLLGYYPDDFMQNSEQIDRDRRMAHGSINFLRHFRNAYQRWIRTNQMLRPLRIPGRWSPSIFGPRRVP